MSGASEDHPQAEHSTDLDTEISRLEAEEGHAVEDLIREQIADQQSSLAPERTGRSLPNIYHHLIES